MSDFYEPEAPNPLAEKPDPRLARVYTLAEDAGVKVGGIIPRRLLGMAGFSFEETERFNDDPLLLPLRRDPVQPLFEYRILSDDGKQPLIFRFCRGAAQVAIAGDTFTITGQRLAEVFDLLAEHLRGPTTSQPDRVISALARIAQGNPKGEEVALVDR